MDANYHDIHIVTRLPVTDKTVVIRKVDVRQEAEILRVINLFNSTIQGMTGVSPVEKIVID